MNFGEFQDLEAPRSFSEIRPKIEGVFASRTGDLHEEQTTDFGPILQPKVQS